MCDKQEETEQKTENSEPRVIQHDENEHEGCDQVTLQESNHAYQSVQLENANEETDKKDTAPKTENLERMPNWLKKLNSYH